MRMTALTALLTISMFACGGGSSNGDDDDAPTDGPNNTTDGPNNQPDGPVNPGTSPIGTTCTPDANNPQGSCPVGFQCLNLQTGAWCSKTCTQGAGDTCASGYDGPGKAECILDVGPEGGPTEKFCGVVCQDMTRGNLICPASQCNGTCPDALTCSGDLSGSINNGPVMVIGQICE
jgi:hypothetical protein